MKKSEHLISSLFVILLFPFLATAQITSGFYHPVDGSVVLYDSSAEPENVPIRGDLQLFVDESNGTAQILSHTLEYMPSNEFIPLFVPCSAELNDLDGTITNPNTLTFDNPDSIPTNVVHLVFTAIGQDQLSLSGWMGSDCPDMFGIIMESIVLSPGRQQQNEIPTLGWFGIAIFTFALALVGAARLR